MELEICELIKVDNISLAQQKIREAREQKLQINEILLTAVYHNKEDILDDILDYPGFNINTKISIPRSTNVAPIHLAVRFSTPEILNKLIRRNADCNIRVEGPNSKASTPLMLAARYGRSANLPQLLKHEVNLSLRNRKGLNALDIAVKHYRSAEDKYKRHVKDFEKVRDLHTEELLEDAVKEYEQRLEVVLILCRHGALIGQKFDDLRDILEKDKEGLYSKEGVPICSVLGFINFETPFLVTKKEADLNWPLDKLRLSKPESISESEFFEKLMLDLELVPTRLPTNLRMLKSRCIEQLAEAPDNPELLKMLKYANFRLGEPNLRSLCLAQVLRDSKLRKALKLEQVNRAPTGTVSTIDLQSAEGEALAKVEGNSDLLLGLRQLDKEWKRKIQVCDARSTKVLDMIKKRNRSLWPDDKSAVFIVTSGAFLLSVSVLYFILETKTDRQKSPRSRRVNLSDTQDRVMQFIFENTVLFTIAFFSIFFLMKYRSRSIKDQRLATLDSFDLEDKDASGLGDDTVPTDLVRLDPDMDAVLNEDRLFCPLPPCCATYPKYKSTKSYVANLERIKGGFFSQRFFPRNETKSQDSQSLPKPKT
jgi:hypothetical protein